MIDPYNPPHKERMLRVHLAEEYRADRDDDSCFVIAILTEENSCYEADKLAAKVAEEHQAQVYAFHDGCGWYRFVDARRQKEVSK